MELKEIEGDGEEGKGWHTLPVVQSLKKHSFSVVEFQKEFFLEFAGEPMECEPKLENIGSPDRDGGAEGAEGLADCDGLKGGAEETEDSKKRKRKPYRPGQHPLILNLPLILTCTSQKSPHI